MKKQLVEIPHDEREGLPSASSMERIVLCPGSFQLEQRLQDTGNRSAADRGTRIHAALEGTFPMASLSYSDRICAERMAFETGRLVEELGFEGADVIREERLWLHKDLNKVVSGKPDEVHLDRRNKRAFVINFKTGRYEPTPIATNMQMLTEGVLVAASQSFSLKEVSVALVHPNFKLEEKISQYHAYDYDALHEGFDKITDAAIDSVIPNAPRIASEYACRWCKGKKNNACPEYQEFSEQ